MKEKIAVAMSGGVDSSASAALLKEQGYDVFGLNMQIPMPSVHNHSKPDYEVASQSTADVQRVADILGIKLIKVDFKKEFENLTRYFCREYLHGRTPNPCVVCNRTIKFGRLLEITRSHGAKFLATGHYAQIEERCGRFLLKKGADSKKDQSYFLFALNQQQLARIKFPVGSRTKEEVRELVRSIRLPVADRPESQDVCFLAGGSYREFVTRYYGDRIQPGRVLDEDGRELGTHNGIVNFTIGQRRGLGVALGYPAYVVDIDAKENTIIIGKEESLRKKEMTVSDVNWIYLDAPGEPMKVNVKIRYLHKGTPAMIYPQDEVVRVVFDTPVRAITRGQAAVFYDGDYVVAGGWID